MSSKVFISYAQRDRTLVETVKKELEKQGRVAVDTVFFDVQDMPAGGDIRELLKANIESSDALVVVLTDAAISSQWVNYEVGLADALGKPIIVATDKEPEDRGLLANLARYQTIKLEDAG